MPSKPVNLRTQRNGKRWFVVTAYIGAEPLDDGVPIFATDPAPAGRLYMAALNKSDIPWTRIRAWAYTDHSLDWEERR